MAYPLEFVYSVCTFDIYIYMYVCVCVCVCVCVQTDEFKGYLCK